MAAASISPLPLQLLAGLRTAVGASSFFFPSLTTSLLFYPLPASSLLAVRLFGCRDAVLGVLLWTAKTPLARRNIVLAGAAVDALDVAACIWAFGGGEIGPRPAAAFGAGGLGFLALAGLGWKGAALGNIGKVVAKGI